MDGHQDISAMTASGETELMQMAYECLGGEREWTGSVRGLLGLIKRDFTITSEGTLTDGVLYFDEELSFDDGEKQARSWRITQTPDGLYVEGDGIETIMPGRLTQDGFELVYRIRLGGTAFRYRDIFSPNGDGDVENIGYAKLFGTPVMKITASGRLIK